MQEPPIMAIRSLLPPGQGIRMFLGVPGGVVIPTVAVDARYLDALEASHAALVAFVADLAPGLYWGNAEDWREIHALLAQAAALPKRED